MSENQNATSGHAGASFNFSQVFWEKTAMLWAFYWLFRWLCPSLLPESLQAANYHVQMLACGTGGLILTLLAACVRGAAGQSKSGQK